MKGTFKHLFLENKMGWESGGSVVTKPKSAESDLKT